MTWSLWNSLDGKLSVRPLEALPETEAAPWTDGAPPGGLGVTGTRGGEDRLGWVDLPLTAARELPGYVRLREELLAEGFERLVVVAMGGSALAPRAVLSGRSRGRGLAVEFLDSLAPEALWGILQPDRLPKSVFLVASKSGTTVETRVLVIRHLDPLSTQDLEAIEAFATRHEVGVWLQPGGPDTARPLVHWKSELHYSLDDGAIRLAFSPLDFVQVNAEVNRALVRQWRGCSIPRRARRCSTPIAARQLQPAARGPGSGRDGVGGGGRDGRTRAGECGRQRAAGLVPPRGPRRRGDRAGLAAPRLGQAARRSSATGAEVVVEHVGLARPSRIVYVSCNPDTLARDAARLLHAHGYRLVRTGLVDMFRTRATSNRCRSSRRASMVTRQCDE